MPGACLKLSLFEVTDYILPTVLLGLVTGPLRTNQADQAPLGAWMTLMVDPRCSISLRSCSYIFPYLPYLSGDTSELTGPFFKLSKGAGTHIPTWFNVYRCSIAWMCMATSLRYPYLLAA